MVCTDERVIRLASSCTGCDTRCDGGGGVAVLNTSSRMQAISSAVALVEFVRSALARPYATIDGTRDSDCHADNGANHHHGNQDADGQPLVLGQAGPSVLDHAAAASAVLPALLLVRKAVLPQSLVCRPHCALLGAGADGVLFAERVLFVLICAVFEVFLGCEVGGFDGS